MTPINGGVPGVPSNLRLPSNHRSLHGHFHGFPMKETVTFCWVPPMAMWSSPPRRRPRLNRTVASTSITCLLRWTWEKLGPGFSRCCTGKDMGLSTTRDTPRWWVYRRESMRMPLNGWFEGTPMTQETSCQMGNDDIYIYILWERQCQSMTSFGDGSSQKEWMTPLGRLLGDQQDDTGFFSRFNQQKWGYEANIDRPWWGYDMIWWEKNGSKTNRTNKYQWYNMSYSQKLV